MRIRMGGRIAAPLAVGLTLFSGLAATAPAALAAGGWSAPVALSVPIPPTDVVNPPSAAINAGGAAVAAWQEQNATPGMQVTVATSADGQHWTAPDILAVGGIEPAAAISRQGRSVAMWAAPGPQNTIAGISASVHPANGSWTTPVAVSTAGQSQPVHVAMDDAGDAVAVWEDSSGVETATLPAGSLTWSRPANLATAANSAILGAPDISVSPAGSLLIGWTTSNGTVMAVSGTVGGSLSAPVTLAAAAFRQGGIHVAVNDAGQAAAMWRGRTTVLAATRTPGGTWTAPVTLTTSGAGGVDLAIDGSGNAVGTFQESSVSSVLFSRFTPGGTWSTPAQLTPGTGSGSALIAATPAGSFVVVFSGTGVQAVTSAPGAGFGPVATIDPNGSVPSSASAAPGHALAGYTGPGPAATVATEPVQ